MPSFVFFLFRLARLLLSGHAVVAVENAALHLQLAAFQRKRKRGPCGLVLHTLYYHDGPVWRHGLDFVGDL
jgi:hypothetical protein